MIFTVIRKSGEENIKKNSKSKHILETTVLNNEYLILNTIERLNTSYFIKIM